MSQRKPRHATGNSNCRNNEAALKGNLHEPDCIVSEHDSALAACTHDQATVSMFQHTYLYTVRMFFCPQ